MADGAVDREEVELQLDILANRVGLLQGSGVADLAVSRPELGDIVASLAAAVEAAGPRVAALAGTGHRELLDLLSPLEPRLAGLAAAANIRAATMSPKTSGSSAGSTGSRAYSSPSPPAASSCWLSCYCTTGSSDAPIASCTHRTRASTPP